MFSSDICETCDKLRIPVLKTMEAIYAAFSLIFILQGVNLENLGWQNVFAENIEEFHDLPLEWDSNEKIPSWLTGTFVRNGPARIRFNSSRRILTTWLDGFAKLHSFKFNNGKVLFSGKMLESPNYLASVESGELTPQLTLGEFKDTAEEWNILEKFDIVKKIVTLTAHDNNNPAVWRIGPNNQKEGMLKVSWVHLEYFGAIQKVWNHSKSMSPA